ncbi:MAG: GtrA family protein [Solirubrobacteraceae bacterium]|jgi:putative flippase GtrA
MSDARKRRRLEPADVVQFVKYGLVGASNTLITLATYALCVKLLGVPYLVSLPIGYALGGLNSYLLNRHWTFQAAHLSHAHSGTRFAVVQVGAILANEGLLYVLVHDAHVGKIAAQAILTVPVVLVTFFINRVWTFGGKGPMVEIPGQLPS